MGRGLRLFYMLIGLLAGVGLWTLANGGHIAVQY